MTICVTKLFGILVNCEMPPLICAVPNPREVATPKTVANTASVSIVVPRGPRTRSPIRGSNAALIVPGEPFLNLKYAKDRAITV